MLYQYLRLPLIVIYSNGGYRRPTHPTSQPHQPLYFDRTSGHIRSTLQAPPPNNIQSTVMSWNSSSSVMVKATFGHDARRFTLARGSQLNDLTAVLLSTFDGAPLMERGTTPMRPNRGRDLHLPPHGSELGLKWVDDEGDMITIMTEGTCWVIHSHPSPSSQTFKLLLLAYVCKKGYF